MKPHPRIRKMIKWGAAATSVLVLILWIASIFWWAEWGAPEILGRPQWVAWLGRGEIAVGRNVGPGDQYRVAAGLWITGPTGPSIGLRPAWTHHARYTGAECPLWIPAAPLVVATVWAWRLDARARRSEGGTPCPKCNYDRTGLAADAVCPECGKLPTP